MLMHNKNKLAGDFKCETFKLDTTRLLAVYHMSEPDQRALTSGHSHQHKHTHTPSTYRVAIALPKAGTSRAGTHRVTRAQHAPTKH
jgi:hypothetical protein